MRKRRTDDWRQRLQTWTRADAGGGTPPYFAQRLRSYTAERCAAGASLSEVGVEIDTSWQTLSRWAQDAALGAREDAFMQVATSDGLDAASHGSDASAIIVHGPCGLRIEGLDVEQVAALVQRLG